MRVISGAYGGQRLKVLKGKSLRPTSEKLRETLYDVLGDRVVGAKFLDAYAGSGAMGIEALSRGAGEVVFLEGQRSAVELVRTNLQTLGIKSKFQIIAGPVETGIEKLEQNGTRFHFAYLDPPYAEIREYHRILRGLGRSSIFAPQGEIVVEHSRHTRLEERYGALARFRLLRHGDSQLGFYRLG
ncbi:MAG: 16S rRNA (guanine(966)-N(2))-methyltransferase RsmD [Terriglobia bacterium]